MADQLPGICWDASTRLFGCARMHVRYAFKLKKNLKSLQTKWGQLQNIRKDVEIRIDEAEKSNADMHRTNEVVDWLQQVQNLQQTLEDIEAEVSQEIDNTCLRGCWPKNLVPSYKIGKKVVEKITEVDALVTSGKDIDIVQRVPPNLVDEMPCGNTVGLDQMLKKVWNNLINEVDNVGIIGLHAMGGSGKTTLLKRVHNELGKRKHKFELVLWVVISKDFNINKVMNDIRNQIGIQDDFWDRSSDDKKAAKIYQILKQKRFVLMLDDLWGKLELERVGVPHPHETSCQSKVVLTTRSEDVCDKMQANVKVKVECLTENEAYDLFCKKVGNVTLNSHREIPEIARDMTRECGGLPLALITVGSAMAGVKSVEAWRQAKDDLRSSPLTGPEFEKKVFSILVFSYDRLPDETHKKCFRYCALYPEDYGIKVEELIDRWIGEGFLGKGQYMSKKGIFDMREEGRSILDKLKVSSLLENATSIIGEKETEPGIKMHDVIRDMALWLAHDRDENKQKVIVGREVLAIDSEKLNDVERISVINLEEMGEQVPVCPNLLTLCLQKCAIDDISNVQYMKRLKVLDLQRNRLRYFPIEICMLINLEYLNISNMKSQGELPIELKNLQKLRTLLVENAKAVIPLEVFEGLKWLQVFRYLHSKITNEKEEILLEKLESLPKLEELSASLYTNNGLQKLSNSKKLKGCVRMLEISPFNEPLEMMSLLGSWSHLEILELWCLDDIREVVSSITPHTQSFHKLRRVNIMYCKSITNLTWLRNAPLLESLFVFSCESMEELVKGDQDLFSNLKHLHLVCLRSLWSIHKRALPFPSLKYIHIEECDKLRKLPLNSNSAKDTLVVIKAEDEWWSNLEWEDPATKDIFHAKFHPVVGNDPLYALRHARICMREHGDIQLLIRTPHHNRKPQGISFMSTYTYIHLTFL